MILQKPWYTAIEKFGERLIIIIIIICIIILFSKNTLNWSEMTIKTFIILEGACDNED